MVIRPARPADAAEFIRMRRALWPDSTGEEAEALLSGEAPAAYSVLVAERPDGGLRGFAEVGERPFAEGCTSSPVAYLEGIWVAPELRRKGVATRLLEAALAWARERGLAELASDAVLENEVSHLFHRGAGFGEAARVICYVRPVPGQD